MNLITRIIGLNILVIMLWGTAMLGGKFGIYIDIPSIIMVVGVLFGGVLLCFPVQQISDAFGAAFQAESAAPVSAWQRQQRIAVFARLYQLAWGGGLVGSLIGIIAMLSDLSDPASIGAGMAVALLTAAYGALLAEFIFNPMQQMVMNQCPNDAGPGARERGTDRPSPVPTPGQTALFKGVAVVAIIVSAFLLPIVSFSEIKKEDALDPATEALYLRYLYGEDAVERDGVHEQYRSKPIQPSLYQTHGTIANDEQLPFELLLQQRIKELEEHATVDDSNSGSSMIDRLEGIRMRTGGPNRIDE